MAVPRSRSRRWPWVAGVVGAGAVLVVAALIGYRVWHEQSPPPPPARAGVVRLTGSPAAGVPPPEHHLEVGGGHTVLLALAYLDGSGAGARAHLAIVVPPASTHFVALARGQATTVPGASVRVLAIYQEPDPTHDAVDVLVTPQG